MLPLTILFEGIRRFLHLARIRSRSAFGVQSLSREWMDRGQSMHREYVEQFLHESASDIRGRCLEFQEDRYTTRIGGHRVTALDILHRDADNPRATIVADLTQPNDIPGASFDCIVCTYVLNLVFDVQAMVAELHRILKPGGVLLIATHHITVDYPQHGELWRFTELGLRTLLGRAFGEHNVVITPYGNSLTTAGFMRGLVSRDFTRRELDYHASQHAMVLCARAFKAPVDECDVERTDLP